MKDRIDLSKYIGNMIDKHKHLNDLENLDGRLPHRSLPLIDGIHININNV